MHAVLQGVVFQPMRSAEQGIEHGRFINVGKHGSKMRSQAAVRGAQHEGLDRVGGGGLLHPSQHGRLSTVLGGVQDGKQSATGPIAEHQPGLHPVLSHADPDANPTRERTACSISGRSSRISR